MRANYPSRITHRRFDFGRDGAVVITAVDVDDRVWRAEQREHGWVWEYRKGSDGGLGFVGTSAWVPVTLDDYMRTG